MAITSAGLTRTIVEPIAFDSDGDTLAGNLFIPADHDGDSALSAAVVSGTWTSVKEQMADRYADGLAARGFAALSFDFAGFGTSGGEPREVESAQRKARDIHNAAEFLAGQSMIDPEGIGALAICASAMYAALAAIDNPRIRALTLVAPWIHDPALVREIYGGADGVREKLAAGERAAQRYARTAVVEYVPVMAADDARSAMPMAIDFYANPARGGIPGWPNRFAVMAWPEWLRLDAVALAPSIVTPTLIVHSPDAAIPDGASRFYDGLAGPREIVWTTGTQFDFYDQEPNVGEALDRAARHFHAHLGSVDNREAR